MQKQRTDATVIARTLITGAAMLWLLGCSPSYSEKPTATELSPVMDSFTLAKSSGNPAIKYRLIDTNERKSVPDQGLRYAITSRKPSRVELIDLRIELHTKYPNSKFRIVDSPSVAKDLDAFFDDPLNVPYPYESTGEHFFATLNFMFKDVEGGPGRWELVDPNVNQEKAIAALDDTKPPTHPESSPVVASPTRITLSDFERSEFCKRYSCSTKEQWDLASGEVNHTYQTSVDGLTTECAVEVSTSAVTRLGLVFHDRARLSAADFDVISVLIRSVDQSNNYKKTMAFIKKNIEVDVCPTCSVPSSTHFVVDGRFRVTAGKSGEPVLSLVGISSLKSDQK